MSSMDKKIRKAFAHITPDILGSVLSDCGVHSAPAKKPKNVFRIREFAATAAALVLLFGVGAAAAGIIGSGITLGPSNSRLEGSNSPTENDPTDEISCIRNDEILLDVMNNKATFITESGTEYLIQDYIADTYGEAWFGSIDRMLTSYTFVDLDQDGADELVVMCGDYDFEIILRCYDAGSRTVYGYPTDYRGFKGLKTDGTYSRSSSATISWICKMEFNGIVLKEIEIAYSDDFESVYRIDGQPVTQEDVDAYWVEWDQQAECQWIGYDNIKP